MAEVHVCGYLVHRMPKAFIFDLASGGLASLPKLQKYHVSAMPMLWRAYASESGYGWRRVMSGLQRGSLLTTKPMMSFIKSVRRGVVRLFGGKIKEDILSDHDKEDEPDHKFYRPLGRRGFRQASRDLRSSLQDEQNRQAFKFFLENPFIRRLAKMSAEFIIGNGISVKSKNEAVQKELDAWWKDPVNNMEKRHFQWAIEFPLYGEIILERIQNVFTGRHRYSPLDPLFVARVLPHDKFPTIPAAIEFWASGASSAAGGHVIQAKILNGVPEEALLTSKPTLEDAPVVYYFRTNDLTGALRGHSNYYPLFEWADVLDNAAFTMGERMVLLLMYVWHLKADNLDEQTKKNYRTQLEQANPGSALMTGKNVDLAAITPDLKNADFTEGARFLRNLISGAAGVPEHWMGEGGDVNRATATAMDLPTLRSFLQQQREYVALIRTLAKANLASVAAFGRLPVTEIDNFTVQVDPINPKEVSSIAAAFNQLMAALSNAKVEGWITDQDAIQLIRSVLGGIVELEEKPLAQDGGTPLQLPPNVKAAVERLKKEFSADEEPAHADYSPDLSAL